MTDGTTTSKGAYSSPKLSVYGGFSQLTASGSMGRNETTGVGNMGLDRMA